MKEKFSISFKNNEKEQAVKEYINTKFNPTAYIKELIYKDMMGQTTSVKDIFDKVALEEVMNMPKIDIVDGRAVSTGTKTLSYTEQLTKEMEQATSEEIIEKLIEDMRKAPLVAQEPTTVEIIKPKEEKAFGFDPSVRPVF